ncbi:MAG: helix-turn-helix transcriptional regulator [Solobacterium sp.]|nr:helix-turn-helix transcriptional regulator [Solobacterium sp.]
MNIGSNIKAIRKKKGITQKALAERTGLAVRTIQDFEYNKIKPKLETLLKIADALQVQPDEIDPSCRWDDLFTKQEQFFEEIKLSEFLIKEYGQETASIINDFLSLDPEGQEKASEYIDFLMQKHRKK